MKYPKEVSTARLLNEPGPFQVPESKYRISFTATVSGNYMVGSQTVKLEAGQTISVDVSGKEINGVVHYMGE